MPLTCPRCGEAGAGFGGCPRCADDGVAVNLVPPPADLRGRDLTTFTGGPWDWADALMVGDGLPRVTLGEGGTALIEDAENSSLKLKLEMYNPTGSHKDRAMAVGVSAALLAGSPIVVAASSGNAGASVAAYAARAGLSAIVTTTSAVPTAIRAQITATGAMLAVFESAALRNEATRRLVEDFGCFPLTNYVDPGPGSNTYAIEGLKSLAYELAREVPQADAIVVPTSRADLVSGIARGYAELRAAGLIQRSPRLLVAEPVTGAAFSAAVLESGRHARERTHVERRDSPAFSIGSDVANFQGLHALELTAGTAVSVGVADLMAEYDLLRRHGLWVEAAAATAVRAARREAESGRTVVAIVSAGGLKDPELLTDRTAAEVTVNGSAAALYERARRRAEDARR